ncbi:Fibrillarin-like rRNA/tRNA 2'-O-methyltransferase [Dirofilaria immitis]
MQAGLTLSYFSNRNTKMKKNESTVEGVLVWCAWNARLAATVLYLYRLLNFLPDNNEIVYISSTSLVLSRSFTCVVIVEANDRKLCSISCLVPKTLKTKYAQVVCID